MEFLSRNASPIYKGKRTQPQVTSGPLAGLLGSLFRSSTPSYRNADGRRGNASAPSASWWQALSQAPSYKTALKAAEPVAPVQEVVMRCDTPYADNGEGDLAETCVCAPEGATQIVILDESLDE